MEQIEIIGGDHVVFQHGVRHEIDETRPVVTAHEDHRELADLLALDQGEDLRHLIDGPDATGHHDESVRVLDHYDLADEEVLERNLAGDVVVRIRFMLELDGGSHRAAAGLEGTTVGGLHHPGPTTGHHGEALFRDEGRGLPADLVVPIIRLGARTAEERDAGGEVAEDLERTGEFGFDAGQDLLLGTDLRRTFQKTKRLEGRRLAVVGEIGRAHPLGEGLLDDPSIHLFLVLVFVWVGHE